MKINIICDTCNVTFERESREVTRSKKKGRKNYCSRSCSGRASVKHLSEYRSAEHLDPANQRDEFTPFRSHLRRAKNRNQLVDITLKDLKDQWELQQGKCMYLGIVLKHPKYIKANDSRCTASLDRIDSSKGYIKGNIQFITMAINYMKNSMSDVETREFINDIKNN